MRRWLVLLGALWLVAGCRRDAALDCAEVPAPPSGCTYDAECELITGGCCGEVHVLAPTGKGQRARAWVAKCAPRAQCTEECAAQKEVAAHCVRGVCAAVERRPEPARPVRVDAGRASTGDPVDGGPTTAGAADDRRDAKLEVDAGDPRLDAKPTTPPRPGDEAVAGDAGGGASAAPPGRDAGLAAATGSDVSGSCGVPPSAPSCERDADCDVVQATTDCCEHRSFPVRAGATVPVRAWVQRCLPRSTCERQCELPDEEGGRCVKGTCTAVVTRVRSVLEKRPWDVTSPRRGVVTPGKLEPAGKKALPAALQKWLKARVPAIEACFTKALKGQLAGAPATRVLSLVAEAKGVTQQSSEGDPLDELVAMFPQMTLEDAGRPAGVVGKARYEFRWTLGFRVEPVQAKRRR